jgi:hypothetical protein
MSENFSIEETSNARLVLFKNVPDIGPWQDMATEILKMMESSPKCQLINRDIYIVIHEDGFDIGRAYTGSLVLPGDQYQIQDLRGTRTLSLPIDINNLYDNEKLFSLGNQFRAKAQELKIEVEGLWLRLTPSQSEIELRMENFLPFE